MAITWFYPTPTDIFSIRGTRNTDNNPLNLIERCVAERLAPDGKLIFETEMENDQDWVTNQIHYLSWTRSALEQVLRLTDQRFQTNDPWHNFGGVFSRK